MTTHPEYPELNDLVDGLLPGAREGEVRAHVANCAECAATIAQIALLHDAAGSLPREATPPPEIWDAIRAATIDDASSQRRRVFWHARYQLAAAAVILLVAGSTVTWWLTQQQQQPGIATERAAPVVHVNLAAYQSVEADYNRTADELLGVLNERRATMDTSVVRVVEENVKIMDEAIARARQALLSDPANQDIASVLATAHESKIRMLNRAVRRGGAT